MIIFSAWTDSLFKINLYDRKSIVHNLMKLDRFIANLFCCETKKLASSPIPHIKVVIRSSDQWCYDSFWLYHNLTIAENNIIVVGLDDWYFWSWLQIIFLLFGNTKYKAEALPSSCLIKGFLSEAPNFVIVF